MSQANAVEKAEQAAAEIREKVRTQINQDQRAGAEIFDKATATVQTIKNVWAHGQLELLKRIGDTPENRQAVIDTMNDIQLHHINAIYNGVQFVEMFNYHLNGQGEWDVGARYVINDFIRGFLNHAPAIPLEMLNVEDSKTKPNPLYTFDPLPISELEADPINARIPVRIETFDSFITGYLENFRFTKEVNGAPVQVVTTAPAIRTRDNYIALNAVYRWYRVTDQKVRQDWEADKFHVRKKPANPIGGKETKPTQEAANEQGV